jgi:outer membrane protein assembly factor BamB
MSRSFTRRAFVVSAFSAAGAQAADWPEWRGAGRIGVWNETGLLDRFPATGLRFLWRTPIRAGYSGPAVADGRVFVTDFKASTGLEGTERALALNAGSGQVLWTRRWQADYAGIDYASGPRAAPTVDQDRVYVLGAAGRLACLSVENGEFLWQTSFQQDFQTEAPPWGMACAPIVVGDLLIAVAAGRPDSKVVAFDKRNGAIVWRALSSEDSGPGYSQPLLIEVEGRPRLIVWHAGAVTALDPQTGEILWNDPFPIRMETPIATPVWAPPHLLVSAFFNGARLYRLGESSAKVVWTSDTDNAVQNDGLHALMASPILDGEHIYGVSSYGQLRCLSLGTGELLWETQAVTVEKARNASAFLVRNRERYWINNDRGELILARLSPEGYEEIGRTKLIEPTSQPGARRELGAVHWSHPAYAGRCIFARNDREILCADLSA